MQRADARTVQWLDRLATLWVVVWLVVGVLVGVTTWHLAEVGDTITSSGETLNQTGQAIDDVSSVPVIGDRAGDLAGSVITSSTDIAERGQVIKAQVRQVAVLAGILLVGVPILPVLGLYVPFRVSRRREIGEIRAAVASAPLAPALEQVLAQRAIEHLSFGRLRAMVGADPGAALDDKILAAAELTRIGLTTAPVSSQR